MAQLTSDKRTQQLAIKNPDETHVTRGFNQIMLKSDPGKVFRFNYNNSEPNYFHCYEHYQDVGKKNFKLSHLFSRTTNYHLLQI